MNEITKNVRKGKGFNLRAKRARHWDIAVARNINQNTSENFSFTPYAGLQYQITEPFAGNYMLTIEEGELPDYTPFAVQHQALAPAGGEYLYIPRYYPLQWSSPSSHEDCWGYLSKGVLAEGDVAEARSYNIFVNQEQKVLLSAKESMDGYLWCGVANVPAHTQNMQYKINFEPAGDVTYWQTKIFLSQGGYLKAKRPSSDVASSWAGERYQIMMKARNDSPTATRHLARTANGVIGYNENSWLIKLGSNEYSGGAIERGIWYWVLATCDGEGLRLYYLADNDEEYTADTLPELSLWTEGIYAPHANFLGDGDFYISDPDKETGWIGRVDLNAVSIKSVILNDDGSETLQTVWTPLIKTDVLVESV